MPQALQTVARSQRVLTEVPVTFNRSRNGDWLEGPCK